MLDLHNGRIYKGYSLNPKIFIDRRLVEWETQTQQFFQWAYYTHSKTTQACNPVTSPSNQGNCMKPLATQTGRGSVHFDDFAAIGAETSSLADDFGGEN